jgi:cation transport ATPase
LALALVVPGAASAADNAPAVQIQQIVLPKTGAKLLSKGVRVLVTADQNSSLDASVLLGESVPGIGKRNARIASGSLSVTAGQASWLTAKLNRRTRRALRDRRGRLDLSVKVRINATAI